MENLKSLVLRARSGRVEAFGEIVRRFQDMACGYAYSILGDFHLAQDAAQEAFIDAYRQLPNLRAPEAFPGWFRRIIFKHCDRMARRRRAETVSLETAAGMAADEPGPAQMRERKETQQRVLDAIQVLPERQRMVTTLFYINGYSQKEIAGFLEVPVTTVKKRLHDSRKELKERMIDMVSETLRDNVPDERFSQEVISKLLGRPRLLEIEGHPVRGIADTIRSALPHYEYLEGKEIIEKSDAAVFQAIGELESAYHVDENRILRTQTTDTIIQVIAGRKPPVRLMTAGRVFRPQTEDAQHQKVFHQVDVLCIEDGADVKAMKATIRKVLEAVFGPVELRWRKADFPGFDHCLETDMRKGEEWLEVAGCGMLTAQMLKKGGYGPQSVRGFAFGLGLERLAMLRYGIDDIRQLWQQPFRRAGKKDRRKT